MFFIEDFTGPIRLTARGEWRNGREPILPRVADLFARHIVVRDDRSYALQLGWNWAPLDVEDAPYFVRSLALTPGAREDELAAVHLTLSDGREVPLDGATLMQGPDNVLYCRVGCRAFVPPPRRDAVPPDLTPRPPPLTEARPYLVPCRFPASAYHALALHAVLEDDRGVLIIAGERWVIGAYDRAVRAAP